MAKSRRKAPPQAAPREGSAAEVKPKTKQALLIELLKRAEGATLAQLVEATSWLPQTTRAALTGLRKKGHVIIASKVEGISVYRIQKAD